MPRQPEEFSENALHMHAWQWAQEFSPSLLIFHVPNGEHRHIAVAKKLKRMGVKKGVADFLAFKGDRRLAIELKDADGEQSSEQDRFQQQWMECGGEYHLLRTLEEFKQLITALVLFC